MREDQQKTSERRGGGTTGSGHKGRPRIQVAYPGADQTDRRAGSRDRQTGREGSFQRETLRSIAGATLRRAMSTAKITDTAESNRESAVSVSSRTRALFKLFYGSMKFLITMKIAAVVGESRVDPETIHDRLALSSCFFCAPNKVLLYLASWLGPRQNLRHVERIHVTKRWKESTFFLKSSGWGGSEPK